ncbi:MAG: type II toxin-antitoxin system death-on-curing family toxin [Planctomycetota bacterium]
MSAEPEWIEVADALFFHAQLIDTFGGAGGVGDRGLLESALGRPRNLFGYGTEDLWELAAAYANGIVRNHPFVDGNKRAAFVIARVFLGLNGVAFDPPEEEAVVMVEGLAAGGVTQDVFASWLRKHSR